MEQFLLYENESGNVRVEFLLQEETIWLTQKALADLLQVGVPAIAKYIGNIYESSELMEGATIAKMETVQLEGKRSVKRFANVQNKLHWTITGKTAAEIIYTEAEATRIYMGLKTWKHAPEGKILKSDVSVAKNCVNENNHENYRNPALFNIS